jgi:hypothetical protein
MNLDIGLNAAAHDRLLETLDNPRHRRIVANYRRHALLEVAGEWEPIFAPDMTIEIPYTSSSSERRVDRSFVALKFATCTAK